MRKRDGRHIVFAYDALSRVTQKTYPQGGATAVFYGYDLRNLQLHARYTSASGEGVTNTYDGFGRLASSSTSMGGTARTLTYQYDRNGNRTRLIHPDTVPFDYIRDGLDRPYWLGTPDWNGRMFQAYGAEGLPGSRSGGNGFTTWLSRDALGRINGLAHYGFAGTDDVHWTYAHNAAGQLASVTRQNDTYAWTSHYEVGD